MTDTASAASSLLPCPFCGSKAVASINKSESLWSHNIVDWTRVHCTNDDCNAQTEPTCDGYEPSAIEVWNRRAHPTLPAVVEPPELSPDFTDTARAALLWVLWHHQGGSSPVEKARRYLKAMGDQRMNSAYFFDDGYPRREISQGALATLAVLEQLAAAPTTQAAPQREVFDEDGFRAWFIRNLPDNTIIGNSAWWAGHLATWAQRFMLAAPAAQGAALPVAAKSHGAWDGLETLADLPDGTELYAHPPAAQGDALDAERYRWLRARWGRTADEYDGDSDQLVAIRESDSHFAGWDVDPVSLDRAIDAARSQAKEGA